MLWWYMLSEGVVQRGTVALAKKLGRLASWHDCLFLFFGWPYVTELRRPFACLCTRIQKNRLGQQTNMVLSTDRVVMVQV